MKKKDLMEFITKVENKAVNSVSDKWKKIIEANKDEICKSYLEKLSKIQDRLNKCFKDMDNILADMTEDKEIEYSGNYYFNRGKQDLNDIIKDTKNSCKFRGEIKKIVQKRDKEIAEVKANYSKLYESCNVLSSAKEVAKVLEDLGFDISVLKDKDAREKALVAQIDKSKLFVCGENK